MSKKEVKTTMTRLLMFEYQKNPSIMKATGADTMKLMQRAALAVHRQQEPGFALYDAIERGRIGGSEILALATIGFVSLIKSPPIGIDPDNIGEKEREILRMMPPDFFDDIPSEIADKLRKAIDG